MKKTLKICTSIFLAMILIVSCICVGTVAPSAVADGECLLLFPNNNSNWLAEVDGKTPRFAACFYTLEGTDAKYQTWVDMTTVIGRAYDHLQFVTVPTAPSGKVGG
ncbi:MAG: hypothetical protein ACI4RP_03455, partial [Acutalibacteraceae bacterium]